jgi:predicted enzyme related to lactoylglutathione lyase
MGNPVVHWELMSKDPGKVADFYAGIFGWKVDHRPELNYRIVDTAAKGEMKGINGGILKPDRPGPWPGNMLFYILVMTSPLIARRSSPPAARSMSRSRRCPAWASFASSPIRKAA